MASRLLLMDIDRLLDAAGAEALAPGFKACRDADAVVVLSSSRTRSELLRLRASLGHKGPYLVENGGAVYIPAGTFDFEFEADMNGDGESFVTFGTDRERIDQVVDEITAKSFKGLQGFHQMSVADVAEAIGGSTDEAEAAMQREFSEAVCILRDDRRTRDTLKALVEEAGLLWFEHGPLLLIQGATDPSSGCMLLLQLFQNADPDLATTAIGSGKDPLSLLRVAEACYAYCVDEEDSLDSLAGRVGNLYRHDGNGVTGWMNALDAAIRS